MTTTESAAKKFLPELTENKAPEKNQGSYNPKISLKVYLTDLNPPVFGTPVLAEVSEELENTDTSNQYRKEVKGVVLGSNEHSVFCKILEAEEFEIQLPNSLFKEDIIYGMPFTLKIENRNGIRTPTVTRDMSPIEIPPEELAKWQALRTKFKHPTT